MITYIWECSDLDGGWNPPDDIRVEATSLSEAKQKAKLHPRFNHDSCYYKYKRMHSLEDLSKGKIYCRYWANGQIHQQTKTLKVQRAFRAHPFEARGTGEAGAVYTTC